MLSPKITPSNVFCSTLAALLTTVSLMGCSQPPPEDLTQVAGHSVLGVIGQGTDKVTFQTKNRVVNLLATDAYNIFRDFKANFPKEYRSYPEIGVQALSDLENQAGESFTNEPIFEVTWNRGDLDLIDFEKNVGVFTEDILSAAKKVTSFNLAGDLVLMDHCMAGGGGEKREVFCNKVLDGLHVK